MFRSIFWRLVASQVAVALFAVAAAGILSYRLFRNHYLEAAERDVIRIARALADEAAPMLSDPKRHGEIATMALTAGEVVGGRVCIFGPDSGALLAATNEQPGAYVRRAAAEYQLADGLTVERVTSNCEPRLSLKVEMPIKGPRGRLGAVMVRAPVAGTEAILQRVRGLSLLTALAAGAVAFLLSLLISPTIASPLRHISHASARIGEGEFAARIAPVPGGEIGDLALTVNHMAERLQTLFEELSHEKAMLLESMAKEQRLEQMRRNFVSNASHQLRTPLTSARGFLEALADGTADTEQARERCLSVALGQLSRMQTLIEKLMDLSRFDAGAAHLELEPAGADDLIQGAAVTFEPQLSEAGLKLVTKVEPGLPLLTVDGTRIVEALGNLLDNAIRVSPAGGVVTITARRDGQAIRFAVEDQGPGISKADRETVWERFYSKGHGGGMGLGLAIVKEIVSAHRGEVFSENAEGGGAVFGFGLPT
jgi:signal transduction histidine kinase